MQLLLFCLLFWFFTICIFPMLDSPVIEIDYKKTADLENRAWELATHNEALRLLAHELQEQNQELRLAHLEIQEQNTQLKELNQEKTLILGMVSHDLKNPISAVQSLAEVMVSDSLTNEQYKEFATVILHSTTRMYSLVKMFLESSRIENGRIDLHPTSFDCSILMQSVLRTYSILASQKNITLHFTPYHESTLIYVDEAATLQILDNLVSNAVKYTRRGGNVIMRVFPIRSFFSGTVLMREDLERLDSMTGRSHISHIRFEVIDEGPGLTEADKLSIFGKFARLSAQPTGGEDSTGLGLAVAKKLTELMGGRIWFESEEGEGARFIVEFPAYETIVIGTHPLA
jgi:signal transduction histidine kinase